MASAAGRPNRSGRAQSARCARLPIGSGESDFNCRRQAWASATDGSSKSVQLCNQYIAMRERLSHLLCSGKSRNVNEEKREDERIGTQDREDGGDGGDLSFPIALLRK